MNFTESHQLGRYQESYYLPAYTKYRQSGRFYLGNFPILLTNFPDQEDSLLNTNPKRMNEKHTNTILGAEGAREISNAIQKTARCRPSKN